MSTQHNGTQSPTALIGKTSSRKFCGLYQRYHFGAVKIGKCDGNAAVQPALSGAGRAGLRAFDMEWILEMRMYSPDELDVMAEAYLKALDQLPIARPTIELTQRLVKEIGAAITTGIRDEDELAAAALARSNLRAL